MLYNFLMKKIFILSSVLFITATLLPIRAESEFDGCISKLKLSKKQEKNIENVKKQYRIRFAKINADIILKKMEIAQLKVNPNNYDEIRFLNSELKMYNDEYLEAQEQQEQEILSQLGFFQKMRCRSYCTVR